jgi:hypothetical protein
MNRLDFFASLPFFVPAVAGEEKGTATASTESLPLPSTTDSKRSQQASWTGLQLSVEAHGGDPDATTTLPDNPKPMSDNDSSDSPSPVLLGPVCFAADGRSSDGGFADASLTTVDLRMTMDDRVRLSLRPDTANDSHNHDSACFYDTDAAAPSSPTRDYWLLRTPHSVELRPARPTVPSGNKQQPQPYQPASLLLHYNVCSLRFFYVIEDDPQAAAASATAEATSPSLPDLRDYFTRWRAPPMVTAVVAAHVPPEGSSAESSPPAAQRPADEPDHDQDNDDHDNPSPRKRARACAPRLRQVHVDATTHLRNLRTLLQQQPAASSSVLLQESLSSLASFSLSPLYADRMNERSHASVGAAYHTADAAVSEELAHAVQAFFPAPRRRRQADAGGTAAGSRTPLPRDQVAAHVQGLLERQEDLVRSHHAAQAAHWVRM